MSLNLQLINCKLELDLSCLGNCIWSRTASVIASSATNALTLAEAATETLGTALTFMSRESLFL